MYVRNVIHFYNWEKRFTQKGNDFTMTGNFSMLQRFLQESDKHDIVLIDFCAQKLNYAKEYKTNSLLIAVRC